MIIFPTPCFSKELFHTRTILSSFPQWWNIMNVSHYVAVVHWANKLTDLMSVLHKFYLMRLNFSFVFVFEGLNVGVLYPSSTQRMRLDWGAKGQGSICCQMPISRIQAWVYRPWKIIVLFRPSLFLLQNECLQLNLWRQGTICEKCRDHSLNHGSLWSLGRWLNFWALGWEV